VSPWDRQLRALGLVGPALEAGRMWMAGRPRVEVGQPLGLTHPNSVSNWARRVGLPGRYVRDGYRPGGALADPGRRVNNARNFGPMRGKRRAA
jgi:hypothetical protein